MAYFIDRTGVRYGRLIALCEAPKQKEGGRVRWFCRCDCGVQIVVNGTDLVASRTQSCGCLQRENTARANISRAKHGHARTAGGTKRLTTPEYRSWKAMLERCRNSNAPNYHLYGGRGIIVCDRWQGEDGFINFLSDMGPRAEEKTLDRINTDGNYTPENCRWSDAKTQSKNRRTTPALIAARVKNLKAGRKRWPRKLI